MEKPRYEDLIASLEKILSRLEDGTMSVDSMAAELTAAQKIIAQCRKRLSQVDNTIKQIHETDRLE